MSALAACNLHYSLVLTRPCSIYLTKFYRLEPDPRVCVYQLAVDRLRVPMEAIGFVSSNCWDACGAKSFGFRTYWINRAGAPLDALDVTPDYVIARLTDLAALVD